MPANTSPVFTLTPNCKSVVGSGTADTNRASPTNVNLVVTGGTNGTRVEGIVFHCTVTNAAGIIRIWHRTPTTYVLIGEKLTTATTPSGTVAAAEVSWTPTVTPFVLSSGDALYFTTHLAEVWNATPMAGDY
jgi:hypothetical protein